MDVPELARTASPRPRGHRPAPVLPGGAAAPVSSPPPPQPPQSGLFHDAALDDVCRMQTFENQAFATRDFMAAMSERLISRSKADPGPFNPRPFIRQFESSVDRLLALRATLTAQESAEASAVRVSESAYASKLRDLSSNFASVESSFAGLEERFTDVGRTALQTGEQLQTVDRLKTRAAEASDLIEYYYQFARGDTARLDRLRKEGGREGRLRTAVIARRLAAIAREVDMPGAEQTRDTIDAFAERFERDMLKLFDKFYRKSDPKMMSHIAKVLQNFNGGHSCVQIYVNQHDFFISKDRIGGREGVATSPIWKSLTDPDAPPPRTEKGLDELFTEIRQTVEIEAQIIGAVFPSPLLVMTTFLQRVFAQSVQAYVEVLMDKASEVGAASSGRDAAGTGGDAGPGASSLAFLRTLHLARTMALSLVAELKMYDFRSSGTAAAAKSAFSLHETGRLLGGSTTLDALGSAAHASSGSALGGMLDQAVEELFVPYMEGVKYVDREGRSLTDLYAAYLLPFSNYHRATHQVKTSTIFDRVRAQVQAASIAGGSAGAGAAAAPVPAKTSGFGFSKLSGFVDRARGGTTAAPAAVPAALGQDAAAAVAGVEGEQVEESDGELSLEVAERMLRWHAEAIGRCVDLSTSSEVPKNAFALLKVLAEAFIKSYLETALASAQKLVDSQDVRGATLQDISPLGEVRQVELIVQLWQHYVTTALLPLAGSSVTVRREMAIYNNHSLLRVEGKCDAILQKATDNIVAYLAARLATQKRNDYAPKNDELAFARINTDPCVSCCEALEKVQSVARATNGLGGGKNAEAFLTEVGVTFHGLLLEHLKKHTVSAAGGIMLGQDLSAYQNVISTFGIPALSDRFDMLRQLGNLFIVQPAVLKSYMREAHLARIDERLLRPYLLRRSDYKVRGPARSEGTASDAADSPARMCAISTSPTWRRRRARQSQWQLCTSAAARRVW
ncbi:exocyst complex component Sec10, partial [Tilletiopsis washingtonensis]